MPRDVRKRCDTIFDHTMGIDKYMEGENVFEYYFEPLRGNKLSKLDLDSKPVIQYSKNHIKTLQDVTNNYHISNPELQMLANL